MKNFNTMVNAMSKIYNRYNSSSDNDVYWDSSYYYGDDDVEKNPVLELHHEVLASMEKFAEIISNENIVNSIKSFTTIMQNNIASVLKNLKVCVDNISITDIESTIKFLKFNVTLKSLNNKEITSVTMCLSDLELELYCSYLSLDNPFDSNVNMHNAILNIVTSGHFRFIRDTNGLPYMSPNINLSVSDLYKAVIYAEVFSNSSFKHISSIFKKLSSNDFAIENLLNFKFNFPVDANTDFGTSVITKLRLSFDYPTDRILSFKDIYRSLTSSDCSDKFIKPIIFLSNILKINRNSILNIHLISMLMTAAKYHMGQPLVHHNPKLFIIANLLNGYTEDIHLIDVVVNLLDLESVAQIYTFTNDKYFTDLKKYMEKLATIFSLKLGVVKLFDLHYNDRVDDAHKLLDKKSKKFLDKLESVFTGNYLTDYNLNLNDHKAVFNILNLSKQIKNHYKRTYIANYDTNYGIDIIASEDYEVKSEKIVLMLDENDDGSSIIMSIVVAIYSLMQDNDTIAINLQKSLKVSYSNLEMYALTNHRTFEFLKVGSKKRFIGEIDRLLNNVYIRKDITVPLNKFLDISSFDTEVSTLIDVLGLDFESKMF